MILDARGLVAMVMAAYLGMYALRTYPVSTENMSLGLIALREPLAF